MLSTDILNDPLVNPYFRDSAEVAKLMGHDREAAKKLHAVLLARVAQDIVDERSSLNSTLADMMLLSNDPAKRHEVEGLAKAYLERWFDVFARRLLQGFAHAWNAQPFIGLLRKQIEIKSDIVDRFGDLLGADFVKLVLEGRIQHWAVRARDQVARITGDNIVANPPMASQPTPVTEAPAHEKAADQTHAAEAPRAKDENPPVAPPAFEAPIPIWNDLTITFLTEHSVSISLAEKSIAATKSYAEMGFQDGRTNKDGASKPVAAWSNLMKLASSRGEAVAMRKEDAAALRRLLKVHFNFEEDPLLFDRKSRGYLSKFRLRTGPLFQEPDSFAAL
jgi:hypothetical protein